MDAGGRAFAGELVPANLAAASACPAAADRVGGGALCRLDSRTGRPLANAASRRTTTMRRQPFRFAWFGGVDLRLLAGAPSEWVFYDTLGFVVLLIACASGLSVCFATSYVLDVAPAQVWWVGAAWAVTMSCGIERLMLQVTARNGRWLIVSLIPRVALSLLVALGMEPLVLALNGREIRSYMSERATAALRSERATATAAYQPVIARDYAEIRAIRTREDHLSEGVQHYRFLESCEATTPSCSVTHQPTCGAYCEHDAREAARLQSELRTAEPEDRARIAALQTDIEAQRKAKKEDEKHSHEALAEDKGLAARLEALSAIETRHPVVGWEVWFFRAVFVILDLLPLTVRVTRMLSIECSPYEVACRAARHRDAVNALEVDRRADVREAEVEEQSRADKDVARARIWAEREQHLADAYGESSHHNLPDEQPQLSAWDLKMFVRNMSTHEARPISVPPALRRGGVIGLASLLGLVVLMRLLSSVTNSGLAGSWLAWGSLALTTALAIYTRGFRRARAWAVRGIFATLLLGLLLPLFIATINL